MQDTIIRKIMQKVFLLYGGPLQDHNASINILNKELDIFKMSALVDHILPPELRKVTLVKSARHSMKQEEATLLVEW